MKKILILLVCISFLFTFINSDTFTATDMHQMKRLSGPVVNSDGSYVLYSVSLWQNSTNSFIKYFEYLNTATNQTTQITPPTGETFSNPVFTSAYPKLLFFIRTTNGGVANVNYINFPPQPTDTPTPLTNYVIPIDNLKFSSSGNAIAFSARIDITCSVNIFQCTLDGDNNISARGANTWTLYTSLMVRHWDNWADRKFSHIFVQNIINTSGVPTLKDDIIDTMAKINTGKINCPIAPDGGSEQFNLSNDGTQIIINGKIIDNDATATDWGIYLVTISTGGYSILSLSFANRRTTMPAFVPGGNLISFLGMETPYSESDQYNLNVYDPSKQKVTNTFIPPNSINSYNWIDGNKFFYICTENGVDQLTLGYLAENINIPLIRNKGCALPMVLGTTTKWVYSASSLKFPTELFIFDYDTTKTSIQNDSQLTNLNTDALKKFTFQDLERFQFNNNGTAIFGFIIKPINFNVKNSYPIAFLIHGGPEGAWEDSWSYRWNPHLFSQQGYAVVFINPRGSTGYGIDYTKGVINDWGGKPYWDLMLGLDYVRDNYPWANTYNTCAAGASYGGYMVNWIQGNTDRFKCLVCHDGVFSTLTMFYATEELWFPMTEYCEKPQCNPYDGTTRAGFLKFNPESLVGNWKTPQLVIHGSLDFRIPISEGISTFTALQLKGVDSRFIHFEDENHWVLQPRNSIYWYSEVTGWMNKYTGTHIKEKNLKFLE